MCNDSLHGKSFTMVVPEEHRKQLVELHDQFMDREYELEGEWEVVQKGGDHRTILANAVYVVDEHGRPKKVTFVMDITDRKTAEREAERLRRATAAAIRKIDEMSASSDASAETLAQLRDLLGTGDSLEEA